MRRILPLVALAVVSQRCSSFCFSSLPQASLRRKINEPIFRALSQESSQQQQQTDIYRKSIVVSQKLPPKKPRRSPRNWDELYQALVEYKEQHGNCNVPFSYKEDTGLRAWVTIQRSNRYCSKKLTPEQKDKLKRLGFDWETREEREERVWNEFFERLKAYRREYLDCCVPKGFKEDPSLGKWVSNQRQLNKRHKFTPHRKEKLESVKFTWSINAYSKRDTSHEDEKWSVKYDALVEFRKEHGHCLVLQAYEKDKSLGQWVSHQRAINKEGNMRSDRKQLLEDIEFVWKVDCADPEASLHQRQWDEMYQHLVDFKETHGHPDVPRSFKKWRLGAWIDTQRREARKGFLDPRRVGKLNAICFTWDGRDEQREKNSERLLAYKR
jgi:hypothetical protein